jgi:uncharacterized protein YydD (DUF2326 family)
VFVVGKHSITKLIDFVFGKIIPNKQFVYKLQTVSSTVKIVCSDYWQILVVQ